LKKLEQSGGNLELAKNRWNAAKKHLKGIKENKEQLLEEKGSLSNNKAHSQGEVDKYKQLASTGMTDDVRTLLSERVGEVTLESADQKSDIETSLNRELEKVRLAKSTADNTANGIMSSFRGKDKWQPLTVDWPTGLDGLQEYLDHYSYIEKEGLPELIDQFKELLNKHATQSLARIKTKLESER